MEQFTKFIEKTCEKPSMFVGSPNLGLIEIFIGGYEYALLELNLLEERFSLEAFTNWLKKETGNKGDCWNLILLEIYGSDQIAISEFPKKYNEFIRQLRD